MNWYTGVLKKYAVFSGRSRRKEYWMFTLINFLIIVALVVVENLLDIFGPNLIYGLAVFVPSLAVAIRRLHDTDRSGWWMLIGLIPVIGAIVLIVFMVMDSTPGDNRFGPNPKS
ncbi:MAG: hypothetical protein A2901_06065 [Elusimicrobia bacterium RIFCSPLOWO2_01_FULL_54_10]|nr:MAG: hypothetical protein A2901_06065 [Elusimicrobia bacterium RIFCSPLOWO2_01_FULL_54_10]